MIRIVTLAALTVSGCGSMGSTQETPPSPPPEQAIPAPAEHAATAEMPMYSCPMHPDVTSHEPGDCSKCGMALVMQEEHDHATHDHGDHAP